MHLEKGLLLESQCGFHVGQGTVDIIFAARQLQEKCQEQRCDLYTTFVDLTKAFNTVSRDRLWKILARYGCPEKFISIVWQFHEGDISEAFAVTNTVKQGCVLGQYCSAWCFQLCYRMHFITEDGICIIYWTDRKLLNQHHLKAVTKVKQTVIRDFLFADDFALNVTSECNMQDSRDRFSTACNSFSLTISTKKSKVMFQPAPGTLSQASHNCKWHSAKCCREVYLSGEHNLKACKHWWGSPL